MLRFVLSIVVLQLSPPFVLLNGYKYFTFTVALLYQYACQSLKKHLNLRITNELQRFFSNEMYENQELRYEISLANYEITCHRNENTMQVNIEAFSNVGKSMCLDLIERE